jgi:hypothetical protein
MKDPVIAADGQTYERDTIQRWLGTLGSAPAYSPVTGQLLEHTYVLPNLAVRALLEPQ